MNLTPKEPLFLPVFDTDFRDTSLLHLRLRHPALAAIGAAKRLQGRLIFDEKSLEELFRQCGLPTVFLPESSLSLSDLLPPDVYVTRAAAATDLIYAAGHSCAQILWVSEAPHKTDTVFDYKISPTELTPLLTDLKDLLNQLPVSAAHIQGPPPAESPRPALFLDRDGVVIRHVDHISNASDVQLMPEIAELIRRARSSGFAIIIVTNQSGIGRQYFSKGDYDAVTTAMLQQLDQQSAQVDAIFFSPYFEKSELSVGLSLKSLRKPRPGMILAAARMLNIDIRSSVLLGDRATDIIAASLAGLEKAYLVPSDSSEQQFSLFKTWLGEIGSATITAVANCTHYSEIEF